MRVLSACLSCSHSSRFALFLFESSVFPLTESRAAFFDWIPGRIGSRNGVNDSSVESESLCKRWKREGNKRIVRSQSYSEEELGRKERESDRKGEKRILLLLVIKGEKDKFRARKKSMGFLTADCCSSLLFLPNLYSEQ